MSTQLKLSGDVTYEGTVDNFLAAKVIALVEQGESYGRQNSEASETTMLSSGGMFSDRSLQEAFVLTGAKTNPQRIAVAGQRAIEEEAKESFTPRDISEQFKSGGFSSKNLARDMTKAIRQGLIFSVTGQRGQYKITDIARTGFKDGFEEVKMLTANTSGRKVKKGGVLQKLEVSDPVRQLPSEISNPGFPDYHSLKMKGDRMVWILMFAADHGVESLNPKEIEYMSRQIGDQISPSSIPSLALSAIRRGFIAKNEGKFRVLERGKDHLRQGEGSDQA